MKAIPDFFGESLHLFWSYVFDVLGIHEFGVTVSGKSWDHMDVRVWHAHSSDVGDNPFGVFIASWSVFAIMRTVSKYLPASGTSQTHR